MIFLDLQNKISKYGIVPILNKKGHVIDYANEKELGKYHNQNLY